MDGVRRMLAEAWAALGGPEAAVDTASLPDRGAGLPCPLPVGDLACATVAAALLAAAELAAARGAAWPRAELDALHVAAAFRSERALRLDGVAPGAPFDPVSAFMPAADGWVRLHGNYAHHRAALQAALGLGGGRVAPEAVRAAVAARGAVAVEDAVVRAGGCAAAVRDEATWRAHPQGAALAGAPLLALGPGPPGAPPLPALAAGALPASGVRVLDLTRVIAGPVGTRHLAALGADVLRVDPPALPEIALQALDSGPGKRSTLLDLRAPRDRATFDELLAGADVLVTGYRPGALAALGLDPAALAERHPALTTVTLSAWGERGPWSGRRGFDSLVQAATGIATACAGPGAPEPGALPAQALDHGTGYLLAAAVLRGLALRARAGRPAHARLALASTARWLLGGPRDGAASGGPVVDPGPFLTRLDSPAGAVTAVAPPGRLAGEPLRWRHGPPAFGADPPRWRPR